MTTPFHILLIEDDIALAMGTEYSLQDEGMQVTCLDCFAKVKEYFPENKDAFDCVLLDVMLPDGNGYEICQWIKEQKETLPVIFLTALSDEGNIVRGLDIGGDDYITKPFRIKELVARIHANVRKNKRNNEASTWLSKEIRLDTDNFCIWKNGNKQEFTQTEWKLLLELVHHTGQVLTREQLIQRLWCVEESFIDDNTLSVTIRRLREKLDTGSEHSFIKTVRGIGYTWQPKTQGDAS